MRIVIAGFGPFPGAPSNPSGLLANALARRRRPALAGIEITSHIFATAYDAVDRDLPKLLARKPDVILIFGLASRRREICLETRARNARSLLFADMRGHRPNLAAIQIGATCALKGNAPFPRLLQALQRTGLPAQLSRDAGTYLCNYAYWRALQSVRDGRPLVQFVHIPWVNFKTQRAGALPPTDVVTACEHLLIALISASRNSRRHSNAVLPSPAPAPPLSHSSSVTPAARTVR